MDFRIWVLEVEPLKPRPFWLISVTEEGIWKLMNQEWSKIDLNLARRVVLSWKRRLRLVAKMYGRHIKNTNTSISANSN